MSKSKQPVDPQMRRMLLDSIARDHGFDRYIILPHPSNQLSKNGRAFYLQEARLKNKLKEATTNAMQLLKNKGEPPRYYHPIWVYKGTCPDDDNIVTRCKYARDAIAAFYDIDDRYIRLAGTPAVDYVHDLHCAGYVIIALI